MSNITITKNKKTIPLREHKEVWEMTFDDFKKEITSHKTKNVANYYFRDKIVYQHKSMFVDLSNDKIDLRQVKLYHIKEIAKAIENFKNVPKLVIDNYLLSSKNSNYAFKQDTYPIVYAIRKKEQQQKAFNQATNLLQLYKADNQGLQGIKKETAISFTAYITAANPRQDKQGRGKLLVQAQKLRVKALENSNLRDLSNSEKLFDDLRNFNFEALLDLIGKFPKLSIKSQDCELIGYWAGEPEPSMQLDFLAKTKNDFWQTIKSLTNFAQTHSQDAFIVSVPLTNTERTAIEKDEILINTQTADGFWYSPVFNLPFADLSTTEQLSIEAEFYKTFGEVGFSMYIYKSKIDNRTVNYKLIFSHEIAKNIDEFFKIIEKTVANIITARSKKFKSSEGFKSNVRKVIELIGKGRESLDYEKVMFFSADNINGDGRTYSKVLAEIDRKMRGLAGLGASSVDLFNGLMTYTPNNTGLGNNYSDKEIEAQAKKQNLGLLLAVEFALFSVMKQLNISFEKINSYPYTPKSEIELSFIEVINIQYEKAKLSDDIRRYGGKPYLVEKLTELKDKELVLIQNLKNLTKNLRLPSKAIAKDADDNEDFWITDKEYFAIRDRYVAGKKNEIYPVSIRYNAETMVFEFITDRGRFRSVLWNLAELADRMQKEYGFKQSTSLESLLPKNVKISTDNTLVISELHSKILKKFVSTDEMRGDNMKTINCNSNGYGATNSHSIFFFPHTEATKKLQGCYRFDGTLTNEKLLLSDETMITLRPNIIVAEVEINVADFLKFVKYKHTNDTLEARQKRFFYKDIFIKFDKKMLVDILEAFKLLKYTTIFLHINQNNRGVYVFSAERHYTYGIYSFVMPISLTDNNYSEYFPKNSDTDEFGNGLIWYDLETGAYPATFDEPIAKTSQTPKFDAAKLQTKAAKEAKNLLSQYKNDSQGLQGFGKKSLQKR